jgi:acyl-CoA dehydrogenase
VTEAAQIASGGFGFACESHVERPIRETLLFRILTVTPQILSPHMAEK